MTNGNQRVGSRKIKAHVKPHGLRAPGDSRNKEYLEKKNHSLSSGVLCSHGDNSPRKPALHACNLYKDTSQSHLQPADPARTPEPPPGLAPPLRIHQSVRCAPATAPTSQQHLLQGADPAERAGAPGLTSFSGFRGRAVVASALGESTVSPLKRTCHLPKRQHCS